MSAPTRPTAVVNHVQARAVAEAPDHPFGIRRHELAVIVDQPAIRIDDRAAVEQRAAADRAVDLLIADHHHDSAFLRRFLKRPQPIPGQIHRIGLRNGIEFIRLAHPGPRREPPDEGGVARKPDFGKHHHAAAHGCGFLNEFDRPGHGFFEIKIDRRGLPPGKWSFLK